MQDTPAYKRFFNGLSAVERQLLHIMLLVEVLLTFLNVLSRYVLHVKFSFTEELVVAMLVYMSMIGAAVCAREHGGLINMSIVTDRLPRRVQLILEIAACIMLIGYSYVMVRYGIVRCFQQSASGVLSTQMQVPEWIFTISIPLGGLLLILHSIELIADCVRELKILPTDKEGLAQ